METYSLDRKHFHSYTYILSDFRELPFLLTRRTATFPDVHRSRTLYLPSHSIAQLFQSTLSANTSPDPLYQPLDHISIFLRSRPSPINSPVPFISSIEASTGPVAPIPTDPFTCQLPSTSTASYCHPSSQTLLCISIHTLNSFPGNIPRLRTSLPVPP